MPEPCPPAGEPGKPSPCVLILSRAADRDADELSLRLAAAAVPVVRVDSDRSTLTTGVDRGTVLRLPINHFEGNYTCSERTLAELRAAERIVLRYVDNPNGATDDIAGICSQDCNVVGLMPHPERASDALLGSTDGLVLLRAFLSAPARAAR